MSKKLSITLSILTVLIIASFIYLNFDEIIKAPSIIGHPLMSTRLVIVTANESICNTTFEQGWNLVSFPCLKNDMDIDLFLSNITVGYQSVRYYTPSTPNDPWKSYNPNVPSWVVNDLQDFSRRDGYWINFYNYTGFYINNTLATPTLIDLLPGWNLIGYPSRIVRKVNDTFYQIIPSFAYVHLYNASEPSDYWKEWTWNTTLYPSNQDLNYTVLYYGYWIYMNNSDTLIIDS